MDIFLCLALWCAIGEAPENKNVRPPITLSVGQDTYSVDEYVDRFLFVEQYRTFAGFVVNDDRANVTVGYLPLHIQKSFVRFDGGASLSTAPFPHRGTTANWVARLRLQAGKTVSFEWWHFSNARSAIPNPSVDALAIGFTW